MTVAANVKQAQEIAVEIEYQKDVNLDRLIEAVKILDEENLDEIVDLAMQYQELALAFNEMFDALQAAAADLDL